MRCLMCGEPIRNDSLEDLFRPEDVLCSRCRSEWKRIDQHSKLNGIPVYVLYEYNEAFSSCLLQYKECLDEALKPAFLFPDRNRLKRMYRGMTLLLMPSTREKQAERGFSHLAGIFEGLGLPMIEAFEKTAEIDQKGKHRAERMKLETGIRLKRDIRLPKRIVLADDVITTGSTIKGALRCLPEGHDVRIFACAKALSPAEKKPNHRFLESLFR